jgi:hypothetical protein
MTGKEQADAFADVTIPVWGYPPAAHPLLKCNVSEPGWHHQIRGMEPPAFTHGEEMPPPSFRFSIV